MKTTFKVGDKVKIRDDLSKRSEWGGIDVVKGMEQLAGAIGEIVGTFTILNRKPYEIIGYNLSVDKGSYGWSAAMLEKYEEPKIKLTSDEVIILKNINKKFKYIARDTKNNNGPLIVYEAEPKKSDDDDIYVVGDVDVNWNWNNLLAFYHIFQSITFESGAHLIADLIKENEK